MPSLCSAPSVLCCAGGGRGQGWGPGVRAGVGGQGGGICLSPRHRLYLPQTWQEPGEGASRADPAGVRTSLWVGEPSSGSGPSSWSVETWQPDRPGPGPCAQLTQRDLPNPQQPFLWRPGELCPKQALFRSDSGGLLTSLCRGARLPTGLPARWDAMSTSGTGTGGPGRRLL